MEQKKRKKEKERNEIKLCGFFKHRGGEGRMEGWYPRWEGMCVCDVWAHTPGSHEDTHTHTYTQLIRRALFR